MQPDDTALLIAIVGLASAVTCFDGAAAEHDGWIDKIRRGHPRLFFNSDTWPEDRTSASVRN